MVGRVTWGRGTRNKGNVGSANRPDVPALLFSGLQNCQQDKRGLKASVPSTAWKKQVSLWGVEILLNLEGAESLLTHEALKGQGPQEVGKAEILASQGAVRMLEGVWHAEDKEECIEKKKQLKRPLSIDLPFLQGPCPGPIAIMIDMSFPHFLFQVHWYQPMGQEQFHCHKKSLDILTLWSTQAHWADSRTL